MPIERTTIKLFGRARKTEVVPVGFEEAIDIVQDPRGFPLIRAIEVISPDIVRVVEYWKNMKARDLRAYFIPTSTMEYIRDEINKANIHSHDTHLFDKIFGIKHWNWIP